MSSADSPRTAPRPPRPHSRPIRQDWRPPGQALQLETTFEGIGWHYPIPGGGAWLRTFGPSDTNADIGPGHLVQVTNGGIIMFDRSGSVVYGPAELRTLYAGFGGKCESDVEADPVVRYDALADRWLIAHQTNGLPPAVECISLSLTGDPTGAYARYQFVYDGSPDFGKFAIWPDGYYVSYLGVPNQPFCVFDRSSMLRAGSASQQCFGAPPGVPSSSSFAFPVDLEGVAAPPQGSPAMFMSLDSTSAPRALQVFRLHVDWNEPSRSQLTGPESIPITPITLDYTFVPQPNSTQGLQPLEGGLNNRIVYRNFREHHSIVGSTAARSAGILGVRWFELRSQNGSDFTLFQEGTYVPDSDMRFAGSAALDASGGIALAYSVSSESTYPGARFTGRAVTDPAGTMTLPEITLVDGTQSQEHTTRWGDYGNLAVDPVDGCTFWYSAVYMRSDSNPPSSNFTAEYSRIGSFKLPSCAAATAADFHLTLDPPLQTAHAGETVKYTLTSTVLSGAPEPLQLALQPLPPGIAARLASSTIQSNGSTVLTVTADGSASGTVPLVVRATGASASHDVSASIVFAEAPVAQSDGGTTHTATAGGCSSGAAEPWAILPLLALAVRFRRRCYAPAAVTRSFSGPNRR